MLLNQNKVVDAKSINASLISIKKQIENLNKQAVKLEKELNTLDNDVYTKSEVYNKSEVYTKGETDNAIQTATTSETLWSWIKGKCATVVQSGNANPVTSGAVKSELDTNYYNKQSVDNKFTELNKQIGVYYEQSLSGDTSISLPLPTFNYGDIINIELNVGINGNRNRIISIKLGFYYDINNSDYIVNGNNVSNVWFNPENNVILITFSDVVIYAYRAYVYKTGNIWAN